MRGIFRGTVQPLCRAARFEQQLFLYSSLLFYFAGEGAAIPACEANRDLINLFLAETVDTTDVCLSQVVLVAYRGYKIVVRTLPSSFLRTTPRSLPTLLEDNNQLTTNEVLATALRKVCR